MPSLEAYVLAYGLNHLTKVKATSARTRSYMAFFLKGSLQLLNG